MSNFNLESNNDKSNEVSLFRSLVSRSDLTVSGYNLETTNALYCLIVSDLFLKGSDINLKTHKECIKNAKDLNIQISEKKSIDLRSLLSYTNSTNYKSIAFQNLELLFIENISKSSFIIEFKNRYLVILNNISDDYNFKIRDILKEKQLSFKNLETMMRYLNRTYKFKLDEILGYCKLEIGFENYLSNIIDSEIENIKSDEISGEISDETSNENTYTVSDEDRFLQRAIEESLNINLLNNEIGMEEIENINCSDESYIYSDDENYFEDEHEQQFDEDDEEGEEEINFSELSETNSDKK